MRRPNVGAVAFLAVCLAQAAHGQRPSVNTRALETVARSQRVIPDVVGRPVDTATMLVTRVNVGIVRLDSATTATEAQAIIRKTKLRSLGVDTTRGKGGSGNVDHQLPEAGSLVHLNEPVSPHVTIAPPPLTIPSVIGLHASDARAVLAKRGFQLGGVNRVSRAGTDSTILAQTPRPGASSAFRRTPSTASRSPHAAASPIPFSGRAPPGAKVQIGSELHAPKSRRLSPGLAY